MNTYTRFLNSEDGPTATEYAILLSAIVLVCVAAVTILSGSAANSFTALENAL